MTAAPTETRQHNAPDGHEVSQVELERRQYRVHQQIQSTITSLISTIVFVVVIVIGLKLSPGWPRVKETFFSGEYFVKSFPHVLDGLWLNIRVLLVAVVGVAILSTLIALVRTSRSPILFPLRILALIYTTVMRGVPIIVVLYLIGFGIPGLGLFGRIDPSVLGTIAVVMGYSAYVSEVLRGISFDIHQHEVVALLGPSGSGKSTLMKCVNLLEQVDDGQIWLGNTDITDPRADQDKIRARIGVVFQQFNLFPHMSVLRNVTLAAIKVHHWSKDRAETRAMELLERIGMRDKASAYPDQLSGGQQQRVAIARALMTDPELLLLDEITSALDPMLVGEVLNMVAELKAQGTTILMATHEMSFAHEAADRIVLLRHGVIAENGTPAEVMDESQDPETIEFFSHFRH